MAIIKCKMCGGDLEITEGVTVAECEYCGTKQTVPNVDNEKKLTLFSRANRLRLAGPVVTVNRMAYPGAPLALGAEGEAVLYYTVLLSRIAYYYDAVSSPGLLSVYTDEVETGTRSLQQFLGLPVTGTVDADTWDAAEGLGLALLTGALEPGAAPLPLPEEG